MEMNRNHPVINKRIKIYGNKYISSSVTYFEMPEKTCWLSELSLIYKCTIFQATHVQVAYIKLIFYHEFF